MNFIKQIYNFFSSISISTNSNIQSNEIDLSQSNDPVEITRSKINIKNRKRNKRKMLNKKRRKEEDRIIKEDEMIFNMLKIDPETCHGQTVLDFKIIEDYKDYLNR